MAATIADVAREAGVSRSTVSSVLTGRKHVSPELTSRIEAAIAKLHFSANSGARALATSRTMVIGLVVALDGPEFTPAMGPWVFALSHAARQHGYEVLLMTDPDSMSEIRRVARTRRVDGLVILSVVEDDERLALLSSVGVPAVLLGLPSDTRGLDAVDLDFATAARRLLEHLHERGHREVVYAKRTDAMFDLRFSFVVRFDASARSRAAELGMTLHAFHCPAHPRELQAALVDALRDRGSATALLVHDDAAAVLLPTALRVADLRVPEDLSVVSLHSTELSESLALPYTAVESDTERVSEAAVATLLRRMECVRLGLEAPVVHELLTPRLSERDSVARLAARGESIR